MNNVLQIIQQAKTETKGIISSGSLQQDELLKVKCTMLCVNPPQFCVENTELDLNSFLRT